MDFTKLTPDKQPISILENLIAWHGIDKVLTAYDAWLCNEDKDYYDVHGVKVETAEELAKEVADVLDVDREYYINDEPAIETELVKFIERWYSKLKSLKEIEEFEITDKWELLQDIESTIDHLNNPDAPEPEDSPEEMKEFQQKLIELAKIHDKLKMLGY